MDDLELIKEKINIVDLIQEYIPLKKSGVNFKANCPFHLEKTPSFMVSPERQIFKCFGCGIGGDIFKFLMEKEGLEFKDALEMLAKRAGVVLKKTKQQKDPKDRLFEVNLKAQEFFHFILTKHKLGEKARKYLESRGVTSETIEVFGIGYAPNSWESLTNFLRKRGFTTSEMVESGLTVPSKNSCYDRFRGRIMFPLIDQKDRLIGFSGRVLYKAEPKYINTPQTSVFDKSNFLFGIHRAKGEIKAKQEAILVEGEMDVILSFQSGVKNVVATKGTALTEGHVELIKKYAQNISLCFDTDLAGDSASRRGIEIADKAGLNIKVVQPVGGKDAAEVALKNPEAWAKAVLEAIPIYDYYLASVQRRADVKDPAQIKKIGQELIPIWAKISDDLVRDHYIQKLAALLRVEEKVLRITIKKQMEASYKTPSQILKEANDDQVEGRSRRELLEEYLIALLLHIPKDLIFVPSFPETILTNETLKQIFVLVVLYFDSISFKGKSFNINEVTVGIPRDLLEEVDRLYLLELDERLTDKKIWLKELESVTFELKKALIKASLERLSLEIKNAQEFGRIEVLEALSKRFRDLSVKLKNL